MNEDLMVKRNHRTRRVWNTTYIYTWNGKERNWNDGIKQGRKGKGRSGREALRK